MTVEHYELRPDDIAKIKASGYYIETTAFDDTDRSFKTMFRRGPNISWTEPWPTLASVLDDPDWLEDDDE